MLSSLDDEGQPEDNDSGKKTANEGGSEDGLTQSGMMH